MGARARLLGLLTTSTLLIKVVLWGGGARRRGQSETQSTQAFTHEESWHSRFTAEVVDWSETESAEYNVRR